MNIKQAKQRFEELTGLPAKKTYVFTGIWKHGGYIDWFMSYGKGYNSNNPNWKDSRKAEYWVTLVSFLETLKEVV